MKPFGELSNEEKKGLLCAWVDGEKIECFDGSTWFPISGPGWHPSMAFRIAPQLPSIDWSHVDQKFLWLAVDKSGGAFLYQRMPKLGDREWSDSSGDWRRVDNLFASYKRGTVDWGESLVARPEEEKQQ